MFRPGRIINNARLPAREGDGSPCIPKKKPAKSKTRLRRYQRRIQAEKGLSGGTGMVNTAIDCAAAENGLTRLISQQVGERARAAEIDTGANHDCLVLMVPAYTEVSMRGLNNALLRAQIDHLQLVIAVAAPRAIGMEFCFSLIPLRMLPKLDVQWISKPKSTRPWYRGFEKHIIPKTLGKKSARGYRTRRWV